MPELPEVETIKNDLRQLVQGRLVESARVLDPRVVTIPTAPEFEAGMAGQRLERVDRRAKYLLVSVTSGMVLVIQLKLTGQLLLLEPSVPLRKSTRLVLELEGRQELRLADSSYLARVHLLTPEELNSKLPLALLGPEVISDEFTLERFQQMVGGTRRQIKGLLLDQRVLSGIGNIYADETLFAARIHPLRAANSLTPEYVASLYRAIRTIVPRAIELRGTTTRSYRDVLGRKGGYQAELKVVGRHGQPCFGCEGVVTRAWMSGRETWLCESCQPRDSAVARAA